MSCVNPKQVEPIIIKFENEDETQPKVGKPCIDFQPDDRWQIKEEQQQYAKRVAGNPFATSAMKDCTKNKCQAVAINGESIQNVTKKDELKNDVKNEVNIAEVKDILCAVVEQSVTSKSEELSSELKTESVNTNSTCDKRNISDSNISLVCNDMNKSDNFLESFPVNIKENELGSSTNVDDLKRKGSATQASSKNLDISVKRTEDVKSNSQVVLNINLSGSSTEIITKKSHNSRITNICDANSLDKIFNSKGIDLKPCDKNDHVPSNNLSPLRSENDLIADTNGSDTESKDGIPPKLENCSKTTREIEDGGEDMPDISSDVSISLSATVNRKKSPLCSESELDKSSEVQIINCTSNDSDGISPEKLLTACMTDDFNLFKSLNGVIKAGKYKPVKFPHTGSLALAQNEVIIESPSLLVPLLIKEVDVFPPKEQENKRGKIEETKMFKEKSALSKNFFQSSVGKFLIGLGMSRVQEWYYRDMKCTRLKQMRKYGMEDEPDEILDMHQKAYAQAKTANTIFKFRLCRCQFCDFKSESRIVMESHYLIPHVTPRREYRCNFCPFLTRDPKEIIFHFEALHGKKAVLDVDVSLHECPFCCFQSRLKTKVTTHINRCRKHFSFSHNQAPPFDFEFPGVTTKPVTISDVMAHRALLMNSSKGRANQQLSLPPNSTQSAYARKKLASVLNKLGPIPVNDGRNPAMVKGMYNSQARQIQQINPTGIQLPPGIVITRPRSNASVMQNAIRLSMSRGPVAAIHPPSNTSRKIVPYLNNTPRLGTSELSITPVTKSGMKVLPATKSVVKNITLTPINSTSSQLISQKSGQSQSVALFTSLSGNTVTSRNLSSRGVVMSVQSQVARMPMPSKIGSPRVQIPYQRLNTPPSQVVKGSSGNTFVMCEICDSYIKDLEELRTHMNWVHKVKIHPKMLVSRPPLNCQKCQWRFFTDQGLERHLLGAHGLVTTNMQEMANKNQDGGRCIICGAVFTYKLVSHMTQVHKVTLKPAHLSYKCTVCTATFTLYRLFESHVYNVHSGSAKRPAEDSSSEPPSKKALTLPPECKESKPVFKKCKVCAKEVGDLDKHIIENHMKMCSVKLCHIEKCEKCLYSSDEMLVIRMSDFGLGDEFDESDDESGSISNNEVDDTLQMDNCDEEASNAAEAMEIDVKKSETHDVKIETVHGTVVEKLNALNTNSCVEVKSKYDTVKIEKFEALTVEKDYEVQDRVQCESQSEKEA